MNKKDSFIDQLMMEKDVLNGYECALEMMHCIDNLRGYLLARVNDPEVAKKINELLMEINDWNRISMKAYEEVNNLYMQEFFLNKILMEK